MVRAFVFCTALILVAGVAWGEEPAEEGEKQLSGMSILGNDEGPKSLVIVPWKSSALGDPLAVSRILDDGRQPVDRDVFERQLAYYEIWAESMAVRGSEAQ